MQLVLRKFDPSTIDDTRICLIIGKRGTGKTILAKDLLYHKRTLAAGICCSGTEDGNCWYQKFIPDSFVYNEFDKLAVERLVSRQRDLRKKGVTDPVFLILDDCMYDKRILREKVIRNLFYNGRHWGIFTLLTAQYMLDLGPDLRTNVDYVFIMREPLRANREKLWKAFGGIFPTFDQFNAVLDHTTENFGCLVINNMSQSNRIEDVAFWFRAHPKREFKMGCAAFWRYHTAKYDAKYDERPPKSTDDPKKKQQRVKLLKK